MVGWRPQLYEREGRALSVDATVLANALATASQLTIPSLPPVFTLAHLAQQAGVDYSVLRRVAQRSPNEGYRVFRIRKRPAHTGERRYRQIAVPSPQLMKVQRWITQAILSKAAAHSASVAFSKGDKLVDAAAPHCECKWLIKMDVRNFFESINEIAAYRVFRSLGYQPLVSLEMARISTRLAGWSPRRATDRWSVDAWRHMERRWSEIEAYQAYRDDPGPLLGHLPQGAPTSPMLANLAMREFDAKAAAIANQSGMIYTRYADDLSFSTDQSITKADCSRLIGKIYNLMGTIGLSPNVTKTRVSPPGARKVVLGLLVDGKKPRLSREFRALMRQHLHYLRKDGVGPVRHARVRGFVSVAGFRNHLHGLATYARQIDVVYGDGLLRELDKVAWPV
ncbi:MAG: reverse transcriptase family protein [Rhodospirillaceae bacterium]|nr:reverse transcriptase family protein [Rhodospirillaceae bacterium]